jgi:hypothetical protein
VSPLGHRQGIDSIIYTLFIRSFAVNNILNVQGDCILLHATQYNGPEEVIISVLAALQSRCRLRLYIFRITIKNIAFIVQGCSIIVQDCAELLVGCEVVGQLDCFFGQVFRLKVQLGEMWLVRLSF